MIKDSPKTAKVYDRFMTFFDSLFIRRWRNLLWQKVEGTKILEAGGGTGLNIAHYKPGHTVTFVDKNAHFLYIARKRAQKKGIKVHFYCGDVGHICVKKGFYDSAVSTFLFCSVKDPLAVLKELYRVLRKDGYLVLLEQIPSASFIGSFMNFLARPFYALFGARLAPDLKQKAKDAGFSEIFVYPVFLDTVSIIKARK